eukprot:jgi/Galph1/1809/GphlegSOOS_G480.1
MALAFFGMPLFGTWVSGRMDNSLGWISLKTSWEYRKRKWKQNQVVWVSSLYVEQSVSCRNKKGTSRKSKKRDNPTTKLDSYWQNFDNLSNELADFCAVHNYPVGVMPSDVFLKAKGADILVEAILQQGGAVSVAERLGWQLPKKQKWIPLRSIVRDRDLNMLCKEVANLIETCNFVRGEMPSKKTIRQYNPLLMNKISSRRSYYEDIAQRLGLKLVKTCRKKKTEQEQRSMSETQVDKSYGYWTDMNNIAKELRTFCTEHNFNERVLPKGHHFLSKGRGDIWYAIARKGGERLVASSLGLHCNQDWRYFEDFLSLVKEICDFCKKYNMQGVMPSYRTFRLTGRHDLARRILRHGGTVALGARLGLKLSKYTGKSHLLNWGPFSIHLAIDCLEFTREHCNVVEGMVRMPSVQCMLMNGRDDLVEQVESYGGVVEVARRLGLAPPSDENWAWLSSDSILESAV